MFAKIIISGVLGISGEATFLHSCKPFPIFLSLRSRSCLDQSLALAAHSKAQESSPPRCGLPVEFLVPLIYPTPPSLPGDGAIRQHPYCKYERMF